MTCILCKSRGKNWQGDDARCAFEFGAFSGDNWNCATANAIRDIVDFYKGGAPIPDVDYRWCEDEKYAVVCIWDCTKIEGRPMALIMQWYKSRGKTSQMYLLRLEEPPRPPTEEECFQIIHYFKSVYPGITEEIEIK